MLKRFQVNAEWIKRLGRFCLMSREFAKEKSPKKEQQKELSSNQDQTDALNEYEFFLPESNGPGECLHEEDSTGEKKAEENQKSDLVDFFLSK